MLKPFGPEIWIADGTELVAALGFHYPTRMAVIRLAGGDLFIWSPVALTDELRAEVEALGTVHHLVAPNALHHVFIGDWKRAFPNASIYAPPGLRKKRNDLQFAGDLTDVGMPGWSGEIEQVAMTGNAITTEIVFFHLRSGTALFTDLLQQLPDGWFSGWRALVAKWDLMVGPEPSVPRKFRIAFTNRRAARDAIGRVLSWPVDKVLMAHGTPVTADGQAFLKRAFGWLTG